MPSIELEGQINSAALYDLPFDGTTAGAITIQFRSNSFVGTGAILKARANKNAPYLPIPYTKVNVAASASDGTVGSAAITNDGIIQVVIADGCELALDASGGGWSSGSLDVWTRLAPSGR